MAATSIEWTNQVWNPTVGCTRVSEGCRFCYAFALHDKRHAAYQNGAKLPKQYAKPFKELQLMGDDRLKQPLHWKKPRMVFVNSMSDLFHEDVPFGFIDKVFAVMALCPQHMFQVLTKRPDRMAAYLLTPGRSFAVKAATASFPIQLGEQRRFMLRELENSGRSDDWWPLLNCWLGTSIENQQQANERLPHLLRCPASVLFVSAEPLLDAIDLTRIEDEHSTVDCLGGVYWHKSQPDCGIDPPHGSTYDAIISWVIVGCESRGKQAGRLPGGTEAGYWDAARNLMQQCEAAGVEFFHKQGPVNGKVSHGPYEWPEDLRIREFPQPVSQET